MRIFAPDQPLDGAAQVKADACGRLSGVRTLPGDRSVAKRQMAMPAKPCLVASKSRFVECFREAQIARRETFQPLLMWINDEAATFSKT